MNNIIIDYLSLYLTLIYIIMKPVGSWYNSRPVLQECCGSCDSGPPRPGEGVVRRRPCGRLETTRAL